MGYDSSWILIAWGGGFGNLRCILPMKGFLLLEWWRGHQLEVIHWHLHLQLGEQFFHQALPGVIRLVTNIVQELQQRPILIGKAVLGFLEARWDIKSHPRLLAASKDAKKLNRSTVWHWSLIVLLLCCMLQDRCWHRGLGSSTTIKEGWCSVGRKGIWGMGEWNTKVGDKHLI